VYVVITLLIIVIVIILLIITHIYYDDHLLAKCGNSGRKCVNDLDCVLCRLD
jgi:hypothetical protein